MRAPPSEHATTGLFMALLRVVRACTGLPSALGPRHRPTGQFYLEKQNGVGVFYRNMKEKKFTIKMGRGRR